MKSAKAVISLIGGHKIEEAIYTHVTIEFGEVVGGINFTFPYEISRDKLISLLQSEVYDDDSLEVSVNLDNGTKIQYKDGITDVYEEKPKFDRAAGLAIQRKQLEDWKGLLKPEIYIYLLEWVIEKNNLLKTNEGSEVVRGNSLGNYVMNYYYNQSKKHE